MIQQGMYMCNKCGVRSEDTGMIGYSCPVCKNGNMIQYSAYRSNESFRSNFEVKPITDSEIDIEV